MEILSLGGKVAYLFHKELNSVNFKAYSAFYKVQ